MKDYPTHMPTKAQNLYPCLQCGLFYEIRPLELELDSAFKVTNKAPDEHKGRP